MPQALACARRHALSVLGLVLVATGLQFATFAPAVANPARTHLVINEISGGNGTGTAATDEFVELYNPTSETITFTGTIQYKSAAGSTYTAVGPVTTFVVAPHGYWLVGGINYSGTAAADSRHSFDMSASTTGGGHLALTGATTGVTTPANDPLRVDLVGWGTANTPETSAAPNHPPAGGSLRRTSAIDTDNNSVDFTQSSTRSPRGSGTNGLQSLTSPGNKSFAVDTAIAPFVLSTTGGRGPYTFAVTAGSLPAGLTLGSASGEISGTPTTVRPAGNVTVRATDANGEPVFSTFSIAVTGGSDSVTVTGPGNRSFTVGIPVTATGFTGSGGVAPYTYAVTSGVLPPGLQLDDETGALTGTPTTVTAASDVTVTATDANGLTGTATSSVGVAAGTLITTVPTIDDNQPSVGDTLTADAGAWGPAPVQLSYQWFAGNTEIPDATGATHVVTGAEVGAVLSVRVTGSRSNYVTASIDSMATSAVTRGSFTTGPTAAITGAAVVGGTLTAVTGVTVPAADDFFYNWSVGAGVVGVGRTLVLTPAMLGKAVTLRVTALADGYVNVTDESDPTAAVARGSFATGPSASITGAAVVGGTLTAVTGSTVPAAEFFGYSWSVAGEVVGTSRTLELTPAMLGEAVTLRVTALADGYADASDVSDPTAAVTRGSFATGPTASITGAAVVGGTLTAVTGATVPLADSFGYAWRVAGEVVGTSRTLELSPAMLGEPVTLTVTAVRDGYGDASDVSDPTAAVARGSFVTGPTASITGAAVVGGTLTAVTGSTVPAAESFGYSWAVAGEVVGTSRTLELSPAMLGEAVTLTVTAVRAGYTDASDVSDATVPVARASFVTGPTASISGIARVGEVLSADSGNPVPAADSIAFRWYAGDLLIPGAIDSQLRLSAEHVGQRIAVEVVAARTGYADGVSRSSTTEPVAARPGPQVSVQLRVPKDAGTDPDGTSQVLRGGQVIVTWSASPGTTVTAVGSLGDLLDKHFRAATIPTHGSVTLRPKGVGPHRLRLVATNSDGTTSAFAMVRVVKPPARLQVQAPVTAKPGTPMWIRVRGLRSNERYVLRIAGTKHATRGRAGKNGVVTRQIRVPAAKRGQKKIRVRVTGRGSRRVGVVVVALR